MRSKGMIVAGVAVLSLAGGALAGFDAGRTVNGFYTAPREPRYRALEATTRPASAWDAGSAVYAASPPAGTIWGKDIGRDEAAFFNTGSAAPALPIEDEWRPEPVRVHRPTVEPEQPAEPMQEAEEESVDGWVDAPDPERLPAAG